MWLKGLYLSGRAIQEMLYLLLKEKEIGHLGMHPGMSHHLLLVFWGEALGIFTSSETPHSPLLHSVLQDCGVFALCSGSFFICYLGLVNYRVLCLVLTTHSSKPPNPQQMSLTDHMFFLRELQAELCLNPGILPQTPAPTTQSQKEKGREKR